MINYSLNELQSYKNILIYILHFEVKIVGEGDVFGRVLMACDFDS